MDQYQKKDYAENTRQEIGKGNQTTAQRFQTGRVTVDIPGLPSGFLEGGYSIADNLRCNNTTSYLHCSL